MDDRRDEQRESERESELPAHETRPEERTGGGLTTAGISAEQYGPADEEIREAAEADEAAMEPDEAPPAYRPRTG
ncbi:MAG: hypothetical protein M3253_03345 [Chloroflexota bacterium]|nr:hypothetical protein [Chloroflexota bacterium]